MQLRAFEALQGERYLRLAERRRANGIFLYRWLEMDFLPADALTETEQAIQLDELIRSDGSMRLIRMQTGMRPTFSFAAASPTLVATTRKGHRMNTNRLNSFTDGVIAIIITIMVLGLPVPKAPGMTALKPEFTLFGAYALSFVKVGIYWFQHHHLLQASKRVDGRVLLANLFFLFWLSLIPFVVRWVGEAGVTRDTVLAFGVLMLLCALSMALLRSALLAANDVDAPITRLAARGRKGQITIVAYLLAIAVAFLWPLGAVAIYFAVAAMWLVPDKRFERLLDQ